MDLNGLDIQLDPFASNPFTSLVSCGFTIRYRKGRRIADSPSHRPDYVGQGDPDTTVTKSIPTMENRPAFSFGADEQSGVKLAILVPLGSSEQQPDQQ